MKRFLFLLFVMACFSPTDALAAIQTFDTPGDVLLGPTKAPGIWYTDRYAPAGFASGETAPDGRTGTLKHSISGADRQTSAFYNTQGRKYDVPSSNVFIQLYIPSIWDSLDQTVSGSGRLASIWGTTVDAGSAVTSYPIIEFNNDVDGSSANAFRIWDLAGSWTVVSGFDGYDRWYDIGFVLAADGSIQYYVDGAIVGTVSGDPTTVQIDNVILQGYNAGSNYDIYWDNLRTDVPEPTTLLIWSVLGVLGAVAYGRRK